MVAAEVLPDAATVNFFAWERRVFGGCCVHNAPCSNTLSVYLVVTGLFPAVRGALLKRPEGRTRVCGPLSLQKVNLVRGTRFAAGSVVDLRPDGSLSAASVTEHKQDPAVLFSHEYVTFDSQFTDWGSTEGFEFLVFHARSLLLLSFGLICCCLFVSRTERIGKRTEWLPC